MGPRETLEPILLFHVKEQTQNMQMQPRTVRLICTSGATADLAAVRGGQRDRRLAAVSPPYTCHVSQVWSTGKTDTHARGALGCPTSPPSSSLTVARPRAARPAAPTPRRPAGPPVHACAYPALPHSLDPPLPSRAHALSVHACSAVHIGSRLGLLHLRLLLVLGILAACGLCTDVRLLVTQEELEG